MIYIKKWLRGHGISSIGAKTSYILYRRPKSVKSPIFHPSLDPKDRVRLKLNSSIDSTSKMWLKLDPSLDPTTRMRQKLDPSLYPTTRMRLSHPDPACPTSSSISIRPASIQPKYNAVKCKSAAGFMKLVDRFHCI